MQHACTIRGRPPSGRAVTFGTFIVAALSAALLVLMSGCHATPAASAFATTAADRAAELRLRPADAMTPLQPFDEGFGAAAVAP